MPEQEHGAADFDKPRPTLGENARRYLRERELDPDRHRPTYRVLPVPQRERPNRLMAANTVIVGHFVVGAFWCLLGATGIVAGVADPVGINQRLALLGLLLVGYGALCIALSIGLWIGARWAWPTAIGLSVAWLPILAYQSWLAPASLLALPIPIWLIWALWRHKARLSEQS